MRLPLLSISEVFRVGNRNKPKEKKVTSFEGFGMSVSEHPEEWQQIARLTGETWRLSKSLGTFVDYLSLSAKAKLELDDKAEKAGLCEKGEVYRLTWKNDGIRLETITATRPTKEYLDNISSDGSVSSKKIKGLLPTYKLFSAWREHYTSKVELPMVRMLGHQLVVNAETNIDGFWWEDELDVYGLSAPRGCIFFDKIETWTWEVIK